MTDAKPTPERIFQVATGYMAAKYVMAADELGVFSALGDGGGSLADVSSKIAVPARPLRIVLDALVTLGFLAKSGERYENAADVQAFLSGRGPGDVRPVLRFWNRFSYPMWRGLEDSIREEKAAGLGATPTDEENRVFSAGVEALTLGDAAALPDAYDFSKHRNVLNVGGWYVSFLLPVLRRYPRINATLLMLPQWGERAQESLALESGLEGRVQLVEGDYLFDPLPPGHDVVLIAYLVHHMSPLHCADFLRHVRQSVSVGTKVLIIDYFTNAEHTHPVMGVLLAGQFQLTSGEGDVYNVEEAKRWFIDSGWQFVDHVPLRGPSSMIVAEAI